MTEQVGTNFVHGIKQAATWGTGLLVGSGNKYNFISEGLAPDSQLIRSAALNGSPFRSGGRKGNELHAGPVRWPLDYETAHFLMALSFGSVVAPVQQGTNLSWLHEIVVASSDKGIFANHVFGEADQYIRDYPTVKHGDITIRIASGDEEPYIEAQCVPYRLLVDQSGANDVSTIGNLTHRAEEALVEFKDLKMYMADQSTSTAIDENHEPFYINSFELRLVKNLRQSSVTTRNAPYTDEPIRNGWFDVQFTVGVAEVEDNLRLNEYLSKGKKMAIVRATGTVIEETFPFEIEFQLPQFQWLNLNDFNIDGPEIIAPTLIADCSKPAVSIAGFAHTDAVRAFVTNTDPNAAIT